ncbi:hypothetical protein CYMTET_42682 [Cymbomonas tetramitiformis]|uniref:Ribosome-assembly protein 3 C-terminal domain-containing protein n=1 Tax=Cymbomonas tetramitiformis TaxID=36881 RepID=A0AAE0F0R5_9CHLO|nr:hypothetical protein CYMTET_42682 [Cymbomonas tetramitiformis]
MSGYSPFNDAEGLAAISREVARKAAATDAEDIISRKKGLTNSAAIPADTPKTKTSRVTEKKKKKTPGSKEKRQRDEEVHAEDKTPASVKKPKKKEIAELMNLEACTPVNGSEKKRKEAESPAVSIEGLVPKSTKKKGKKQGRLELAVDSKASDGTPAAFAPTPSQGSTKSAPSHAMQLVQRLEDFLRSGSDDSSSLQGEAQMAPGDASFPGEAEAKAVAASGPEATEEFFNVCGRVGAAAAGLLVRVLRRNAELLGDGEGMPRGADARQHWGLASDLADNLRINPASGGRGANTYEEARLWSGVSRHNAAVWQHARTALLPPQQSPQALGAALASDAPGEGNADILNSKGSDQEETKPASFRDFYMDCFMESFGDDMEKMRRGEGSDTVRVDFLLQCIESGVDIFSDVEQRIHIEALRVGKKGRPIQADSRAS